MYIASSSARPRSPLFKIFGRGSSEAGATMLEFAIVGGLLIFLTFGLIDLGRYYFARNLLTRAALMAVNRAKKELPIGYDIRNPAATDPAKLAAFTTTRDAILQQATSFAETALLRPSALGGQFSLFQYSMTDGGTTAKLDGALLMPGHNVTVAVPIPDGQTQDEIIQHPSCPTQSCPEYSRPGQEGYDELLLNHPLSAELRARVPLFILGGREVTVVGRALAYHEVISTGMGVSVPMSPSSEVPPPPDQCDQVHTKESYCAKIGCEDQPSTQPWEKCDFQPTNRDGYCGTCGFKKCSEWSSQEKVCPPTQKCSPGYECKFFPDFQSSYCGGCYPVFCYTKTSQAEVCSASATAACSAAGLTCNWFPYNLYDPANPDCCGGCGLSQCKNRKTVSEVCSPPTVSCPSGLKCVFDSEGYTETCERCEYPSCAEVTNEQEACGKLACPDGQFCKFRPTYPAAYNGDYCTRCEPIVCNPPASGCPAATYWLQSLCQCVNLSDG